MSEANVERSNKRTILIVLGLAGLGLIGLVGITMARSASAPKQVASLPTMVSAPEASSIATSSNGGSQVNILPASGGATAMTASSGNGDGIASPGSMLLADNQSPGAPTPNTGSPAPNTPTDAPTPSAPSTTPSDLRSGSADASGSQPVAKGYDQSTLPVQFSLNFENNYDDNIYIRHTNRVGDFYWTITPGVDYSSRQIDPDLDDVPENYIHASYKATFAEFLNQTSNDFIDHDAEASYMFTGAKLKMGIDGMYYTSHYPNIDFGGRLKASYYNSDQYASYAVGDRLTLGSELTETLSRYNQGINTDEYTATGYLDYDVAPKTTVGIGSTSGYIDVQGRLPDQFYEQLHARLNYQLSDKISVSARVGGEYREYQGGANTVNPNAAVVVGYRPFDSTNIQFTLQRKSIPSISQSTTNYNDSSASLVVRQRICENFYLQLATSYEHDDYYSVVTGRSTQLEYDFVSIRPSIEWDWNKYLKFNAYYGWENNSSSSSFSNFYDNSVGMGASFTY